MRCILIILIFIQISYALDSDQVLSSCGDYKLTGKVICEQTLKSFVLHPNSQSRINIKIIESKNLSLSYFCNSFVIANMKITSKGQFAEGRIIKVEKLSSSDDSHIELLQGNRCIL